MGPANPSPTGATDGTRALRNLSAVRITLPVLAVSFGIVLGVPLLQRFLVARRPAKGPAKVSH